MQIRCNFPDISYLSETQKNNFQFLNKTIISETFCVFFPLVKTSNYHLKVIIFKLTQIFIWQTTIVEKH